MALRNQVGFFVAALRSAHNRYGSEARDDDWVEWIGGVWRQDRARYSRFGAGLGTLRRAERAGERPECALSRLGRHRDSHLGLLRRPGRDACHDTDRRARYPAVPVSHHGAVLTYPRVPADRA